MALKVDRDTAGKFAFYSRESWQFFSDIAVIFIATWESGAIKITSKTDFIHAYFLHCVLIFITRIETLTTYIHKSVSRGDYVLMCVE